MSTNMPILERFLSYVDFESSKKGCWLWKGGIAHNGYGRFKLNYMSLKAHRFSYAVFNELPEMPPPEFVVRHKCDIPACCNPLHLVGGTQLDNIMDREERGRTAKGETNGFSKLTNDQVLLARAMLEGGASNQDVADFFNVGTSCISDIKLRKTWRHL